jgi:hypothetical protein
MVDGPDKAGRQIQRRFSVLVSMISYREYSLSGLLLSFDGKNVPRMYHGDWLYSRYRSISGRFSLL